MDKQNIIKGKLFKNFLIVFVLLFLGFTFSFLAGNNNKGAKNIQINADNITMDLNKKRISAELLPKSQEIFLVDSGGMSSNIGEFYVVPMEKVKYLEKNYPDFLNCPSLDADEYKNNLIYVGFISTDQNTISKMNEATKLFKGVVEITGSKLKIVGQKETPDTGFLNLIGKNPGTYYFIDNINVLDERYRLGKNY